MLIDVHAHLFTPGMLNRHPFWGPFMKPQGLTVGHFSLGTKQPAKAATDAEAEANLLARMTHEARLAVMEQRGVDKLVLSTLPRLHVLGRRIRDRVRPDLQRRTLSLLPRHARQV